MNEIEKNEAKEINKSENCMVKTTEVTDFESVISTVVERMEESGFQIPSDDEIAELSDLLGVTKGELQTIVDIVESPHPAMESMKLSDIKPNNNYLAYCTFAGCQGTCRGCAGRH